MLSLLDFYDFVHSYSENVSTVEFLPFTNLLKSMCIKILFLLFLINFLYLKQKHETDILQLVKLAL